MARPFDVSLEYVFGRFDPVHGILYSGCTKPRTIIDAKDMRALFAELHGIIRRCPTKPALFVDYTNVSFDPSLGAAYREAIASLQKVCVAIYRYNVRRDTSGSLTSAFVRVANMSARNAPNMYASEKEALEAYLATKRAATP